MLQRLPPVTSPPKHLRPISPIWNLHCNTLKSQPINSSIALDKFHHLLTGAVNTTPAAAAHSYPSTYQLATTGTTLDKDPSLLPPTTPILVSIFTLHSRAADGQYNEHTLQESVSTHSNHSSLIDYDSQSPFSFIP